MSMSAAEFLEKLSQVKAGVKAGETNPDVERLLGALVGQVKGLYTPEALKSAAAAGTPIDAALEETMTTLHMTWTSVRGRT